MIDRTQLAKDAFYGNNEGLMFYLYELDSYEIDGCLIHSNGMALDRTITLVNLLTDEQIEQLQAVGVIE